MSLASKCLFRRRCDVLVSVPNSSGDRFRVDFCDSFDEQGRVLVKECGSTDWQAYIDSHFDSVDLYTILSRIVRNPENIDDVRLALDDYLRATGQGVSGSFLDLSGLPKNIHEVNKGYVQMTEFFNNLPASVRHDFHNSVDEFVAGFQGFIDKYGQKPQEVSNDSNVSEVKSDE